jgi:hypothetical protein
MVHYTNPIMAGLDQVVSLGDGYTIALTWFPAQPDVYTNKVAYHIYYSINQDQVFNEGVKFVIIDGSTTANIIDLTPGQDYWFSVRPVEYNPSVITFLQNLPIAHDNVRFYPSSILSADIGATDLVIPLVDVEGFPNSGLIKVGVELIAYLAVDTVNNNLIVSPGGGALPAHLVLQPNSQFYLPNPNNVGNGIISMLMLQASTPPTETWTLKCIFVQRDNGGNPIAGTAKFEAVGSISGNVRDQYGNPFIWTVNGPVVSNGILSFMIVELGPTFVPGDSFTIQVEGITAGAPSGRGFNGTIATEHTVSGFDGYTQWSPIVSLLAISEDTRWDMIFVCQSRFEYPNFPFTIIDGYHQTTKDILSTDLSAADAANVTFPMYDYSGYHRTDPVLLLNGTCVGSYIGGQMGCIDANGNYNIYRGMSLQQQNTQRQDILLSVTGRPAVLIKREQTGITCSCYLTSSEYPDDRCPFCYGTKFVFGYVQYFNPRQSDGRIMVRTGPTAENLKMYEAGMESEYPLDIWTLTVPTIKTRDVLVLFDQDDNEEFRYEVAAVTRNNTILGLDGGQHLATFRVRKFDPIYQIRIFRDTSDFPSTLQTSLGFSVGLPPHTHNIVINEKVLSVNQINQTTDVAQGHNHPIVNGQVMEVLGHTHTIILPS